jgi:hypothetical protein
MREYDYKFLFLDRGCVIVKGVIVKGYPEYSVMAGQDVICYIDSFDTLEEAQAAYPEAASNLHNRWTAPTNYTNHLPDEDVDW